MNKYRNGKIYKLIDLDSDKVYIGSTTQTLHDRLNKHKNPSNNCMSNTFKDPYIQLIKSYPCNSKRALDKEEQKYIDMYDCVNKQKSFQTKEEKKEQINKYQKQYYIEHDEELKKYQKQYHTDRKDVIYEKIKKYQIVNKDKIKQRQNQVCSCECGKTYTRTNKIQHMKSKKHINYLLGFP
mgnify:FL=1